ncbi:MAG TPA: patatin-like phospholipase family protein [Steroidobacteraceae bacterium]|nr:patatin-like phospholipase family protein [Steroidobacteraceae bacterium]
MSDFSRDFAAVEQAEADWIRERRLATGSVAPDAPLVGLALSGGGIRSAAFNMGVLQVLARSGLLARTDYLSSVSGGGYVASCLTWLRAHVPETSGRRLGEVPLTDGSGTVLDWLRAHGRYLITGKGLSGWTLGASILSGTLLNLFVLLPLMLGAVFFASQDWFQFGWPAQMRLPGADFVGAHDGFIVIGLLGVFLLALYLLATLVFALSTVLPPLRQVSAGMYLRQRLGQLLAGGLIGVAVGLFPVMAGIEETAMTFLRMDFAEEVTRHATWLVPLITGALSVRQANKKGAHSDTFAVLGLVLVMAGLFTALYHLANHTPLMKTPIFAVWFALSLLFAFVCDINAVSMHSYYRSQLAEAFLPEVGSGRNPLLFRLADVRATSGGPFHIINTTLNTTSSANATMRARNGENMILTPLYCGSSATGYRRTTHYLRGELTLSTAFSVSGAAVDPDTYATNSRPVSFLMTLLNIRLGVWLANPAHEPRRFRWPAWYQLMMREMFGVGLDEKQSRIHLADGGHFENLGMYELLRRRCRYIIVSDAGADPDTTLADLGQAVQRARADFGASVDICADALINDASALRKQAHLIGRVSYADGSSGEILYLKALLRTHLGADIYGYWRTNPEFPNQPTSNQFYGEMQFDSYRELGRELMSGIVGEDASGDIERVFARWRTQKS